MTNDSATAGELSDEFTAVEQGVIDHLFQLQPQYAVFLGLHTYDGRLPDLSEAGTESWATGADGWLRRLHAFAPDHLPKERQLDRVLLQLLLESPLFDLRDAFELEHNPMAYVGTISLTPYIARDYAPIDQRTEAMVRVLEGFPAILDAGRRRLKSPLPEPFLRLTLSIGGGLPEHFAEAESAAARGSAALGAKVAAARPSAEKAIHEFLARVRDEYLPKATREFALGLERYQRLLWVREGIRTPVVDILALGERDLRRNQVRLEELAQAARPPGSIAAVLERLFRDHATASGLLDQARGLVDETRSFVEHHQLVTVPSNAVCRVEETPTYGRALSTASMNPPGPFDEGGDVGIYYITPVDSTWTPERQEEWLRSLNAAMLRNVTVHEVYPGHYLQFLHFRKTAGSLARRVYLSSSFTEGWAHYAEQLAIEAGLGDRGTDAEVAQVHDALLRDCRLIASIGLHTRGWDLERATALFQHEAHFERLPAEREAIRGTFNPEYFCYTLGKLTILDVRTKYLESRFGGSLKSFHDHLLSLGSPPVGLLDPLLGGRSVAG